MNRSIILCGMILFIVVMPKYVCAMDETGKSRRYPRVNRDIPTMHPELSVFPDEEARRRMTEEENNLWCDAIELRWRDWDNAFMLREKHRESEFGAKFAHMILRCLPVSKHRDPAISQLFSRSIFYQCTAMKCGLPGSIISYLGKVFCGLDESYSCGWTAEKTRNMMIKALRTVLESHKGDFAQQALEVPYGGEILEQAKLLCSLDSEPAETQL